MPRDLLMRIHSPESHAMSERMLRTTELTSPLNIPPFDDDAGKAGLFEQILGSRCPPRSRSSRPSTPTTVCCRSTRLSGSSSDCGPPPPREPGRTTTPPSRTA
jgi:hypothetical protein